MEKLMDITQLAEYLQMNKMTVYKLARKGEIPAFKVASEWRFRKDLIDKWLMSQIKDNQGMKSREIDLALDAGKTVLIVDDEEVIREFFLRVLKGYRTLTAVSGEDALAVIEKEEVDLVLLDIKMPGIDGIETLKRIKAFNSEIGVIMLSAYGTLEKNIEAARLGAYSSIAKPFDLEDMKRVIQKALS